MHVWLTRCPIFRFVSLFFLTQMLTDLLRQLVGSGVRIVTLDHHLKETDFVKSGEVCICWHRDSISFNIPCTLWYASVYVNSVSLSLSRSLSLSLSLSLELSLSLSPSHTHTHAVTSWHHCSIERRIFQGKKIPTTVTMNYFITLLSQNYFIISRLFYLKTSVPTPSSTVTSYLSRTMKGYEWWLDNPSRWDMIWVESTHTGS